MGILDSLSSAYHSAMEAIGLEAPPPPPPPPSPPAPEPQSASPATAQSAADAASAHAADPVAAALQARVQASASNPAGVNAPDGAAYAPADPKVADDVRLPKEGDANLDGFTQMNGPPGAGERCGAATIVAAAVQAKGAAGAAELAANLAKDPGCPPDLKKEYSALSQRLRGGSATYGDLGKLSATIHKQYSSSEVDENGAPVPGTAAISGSDMSKLMKVKPIAAPPDTRTWQSGTSWPMKLNIQNNGGEGNHWVLMTRDRSGAFKAWDPMPKEGASQRADGQAYYDRMGRQLQGAQSGKSSFGFPSY